MKVRLMSLTFGESLAQSLYYPFAVFQFSEVGEWAYRYMLCLAVTPEEEAVVRLLW